MAYINKKDQNGTKPLLQEGELGYDKYVAGGDVGRIYVGTGSENIAQAQKQELDAEIVRATGVENALDTRVAAIEDNTTLAEYGITDAYTKVEVEALLDAQDEATELVYDNTASGMTATTVQGAIDEVEDRVDTAETKLATIETNAKDDQDASEVPVTPAGNMVSTDVQSALEELQDNIEEVSANALAFAVALG